MRWWFLANRPPHPVIVPGAAEVVPGSTWVLPPSVLLSGLRTPSAVEIPIQDSTWVGVAGSSPRPGCCLPSCVVRFVRVRVPGHNVIVDIVDRDVRCARPGGRRRRKRRRRRRSRPRCWPRRRNWSRNRYKPYNRRWCWRWRRCRCWHRHKRLLLCLEFKTDWHSHLCCGPLRDRHHAAAL